MSRRRREGEEEFPHTTFHDCSVTSRKIMVEGGGKKKGKGKKRKKKKKKGKRTTRTAAAVNPPQQGKKEKGDVLEGQHWRIDGFRQAEVIIEREKKKKGKGKGESNRCSPESSASDRPPWGKEEKKKKKKERGHRFQPLCAMVHAGERTKQREGGKKKGEKRGEEKGGGCACRLRF